MGIHSSTDIKYLQVPGPGPGSTYTPITKLGCSPFNQESQSSVIGTRLETQAEWLIPSRRAWEHSTEGTAFQLNGGELHQIENIGKGACSKQRNVQV